MSISKYVKLVKYSLNILFVLSDNNLLLCFHIKYPFIRDTACDTRYIVPTTVFYENKLVICLNHNRLFEVSLLSHE